MVLGRASGTGGATCSPPARGRRRPRARTRPRQPDAPQPPAEVDVLDVHEVALVPPADVVERATGAARRARPTPSRRRAARSGRRRAGGSARVNGLRGHHEAEQRRGRPRPAIDGSGARRRVVASRRGCACAGRRRRGAGSASSAAEHRAPRCPAPPRVSALQHRDDRRRGRGDAEVGGRARSRRCPGVRRRATSGTRARSAADRAVGRAVVDDDELDGARRWSSASTERDAVERAAAPTRS